MNDHSQAPDTQVASAQATQETQAPAMKDKATLQELLQTYGTRTLETLDFVQTNKRARLSIYMSEAAISIDKMYLHSDWSILDLDNLSTLDDYHHMLTLSQKCLQEQVEYHARERVIHAKLKEIVELEAGIADHASELENYDPGFRESLAARMKSISDLRINSFKMYWTDVSKGSVVYSENTPSTKTSTRLLLTHITPLPRSIHRKIFAFDQLRSLSTIPTISSRSPAFLDTLSTATNTHDLTDGDDGSATSNTHDLSARMTGAEDQGNLNLNDNTLHQPTPMSPEAKEHRCAEIKEQIQKLEQEIITNTVDCRRHFSNFDKYNRRYLRLRKTMGDLAQPVMMDTNNESRLRKANILLTLDLDRVKAFSAATKGLRRELEIVEEIKELFVEMAGLKGVVGIPEYQEALDDILAKVETQHETRRIIGRHLLELVRGRGGS